MDNKKISQEFFAGSMAPEGLRIDFKRVLYTAQRYWYLVVLSLLAALAIAFLRNRYATRIYPVTASIILKEAGGISGGELLYSNPLVNYKRNYQNELYIIESFPLVRSVIKELNFGVSFYKEGNFLITEAYDYIPVEAFVADDGEWKNVSAVFTILDEQTFELREAEAVTRDDQPLKFQFGDTITFNGVRLLFDLKTSRDLLPYVGIPFIFSYVSPDKLTSDYILRLNADWAEQGAGVINLRMNGPNPNKDSDFIEGLIKQYQDYDLQKKNQTATRTVDFISEQLEGISDSLRNVEQQLERFKNENVVTDLTGEALRLYQKLEELETQKTNLIINNNYYNYLIEYIQQDQSIDQIILPSSIGVADPILTGLVMKMVDMQLELKMMTKSENPSVKEVRRGINEVKNDIVESISNQRSTGKIRQSYLNKQIKDVEKQLDYLPIAERRLVSIQRNYTLLENLYIFLLQKRSEAAISKASNTSDIIVVDPPKVAGNPIAPRVTQNYAIAALAGIAFPFFIFGLVEFFNTKVQSKEDIEMISTIPFIGGVGHKTTVGTNEVVFHHPKSALAESFRAIRSNLSYFVGQRDQCVFLVTSSIGGEGKTFTALNLASVLALTGKRTVLVGADMRKPRLFDDFGLSNDIGLSTYLAGFAEFNAIIQRTEYQNLHLISAGPVPPNPNELLLTPRMNSFMEEAKAVYDYIVVDTPPLAIVTDALLLSAYADHSLFVVRQNYTHKNLLTTVQDLYSSKKLKGVSIVLNDIVKSGPGYGYGYGYGYANNGYYSDGTNDEKL